MSDLRCSFQVSYECQIEMQCSGELCQTEVQCSGELCQTEVFR